MLSLIDQMKLAEKEREDDTRLTPDERNRLSSVHRMFHMIVVRWSQSMGFGYELRPDGTVNPGTNRIVGAIGAATVILRALGEEKSR